MPVRDLLELLRRQGEALGPNSWNGTRRFSAGFSPAMRATLNRRRMFQSRYTHSWNILMRAIASVRATPPFRYIEHPFDKRHGLDTAGYLSKRDLVTGHPNDVYLTGYSAVAPSVFRQMCRRWIDTLAARRRVQAFSFVDVGAGKGRALLLASELPFRKVIG